MDSPRSQTADVNRALGQLDLAEQEVQMIATVHCARLISLVLLARENQVTGNG